MPATVTDRALLHWVCPPALCLDPPMMSESRFTCAVQTEEAAHGAQTGTPALMLMMLMDGAVVTSMQGALMLGFLDVLGPLGSPGFLANCPCVN